MNKQRKAILIVSIAGALATFMPWVKVPLLGSINGSQGDGWITFALFLVPAVISQFKDKSSRLEGGILYTAILPGLLASFIGIWKISDFKSRISGIGDNPFAQAMEAAVSIEFGLYLVVIAGFALPIAAYLVKEDKQPMD
jgi:hypothetical protein